MVFYQSRYGTSSAGLHEFRSLEDIQWLRTVSDDECPGGSDQYAVCRFPLSLSLCRHSSVFYCLTVMNFGPVIHLEPDSIDCSSVDYLHSSIFLIMCNIAIASYAAYIRRTCNLSYSLPSMFRRQRYRYFRRVASYKVGG